MNEPVRKKLETVDRLVERAYGRPRRRRRDPLEVLIETILSQNTNDKNSSAAYTAMREAFPTWEDVMNAPGEDLAAALRPGGLAQVKSHRIQRILRAIADQGPLNLDALRGLSNDKAEQVLLGFDGVGPKTARCVLLFALGRDAFPVDTHIARVLKRLGILPGSMSPEQAHAYLPPFIAKGRCHALHLNLIAHGRRVCHSRNPACDSCILRGHCPWRRAD